MDCLQELVDVDCIPDNWIQRLLAMENLILNPVILQDPILFPRGRDGTALITIQSTARRPDQGMFGDRDMEILLNFVVALRRIEVDLKGITIEFEGEVRDDWLRKFVEALRSRRENAGPDFRSAADYIRINCGTAKSHGNPVLRDLFQACSKTKFIHFDINEWLKSETAPLQCEDIISITNVSPWTQVVFHLDLSSPVQQHECDAVASLTHLAEAKVTFVLRLGEPDAHPASLLYNIFWTLGHQPNVEVVKLILPSFPKKSFWVAMASELLRSKYTKHVFVEVSRDGIQSLSQTKLDRYNAKTFSFLMDSFFIKALRSNSKLELFEFAHGSPYLLENTLRLPKIEMILEKNIQGRSLESDVRELIAELSTRPTEFVLNEAAREWSDEVLFELINHCVQHGILSARNLV